MQTALFPRAFLSVFFKYIIYIYIIEGYASRCIIKISCSGLQLRRFMHLGLVCNNPFQLPQKKNIQGPQNIPSVIDTRVSYSRPVAIAKPLRIRGIARDFGVCMVRIR